MLMCGENVYRELKLLHDGNSAMRLNCLCTSIVCMHYRFDVIYVNIEVNGCKNTGSVIVVNRFEYLEQKVYNVFLTIHRLIFLFLSMRFP